MSNFYQQELTWAGRTWPTAEHAYQAAKTLDPNEQEKIRKCETPGQAKRMGKKVTIRSSWDQMKSDVMLSILRAKFKNPVLAEMLLATEDVYLEEGNTWGDRYWGVCQGYGLNKLGILLMKVRSELQSTQSPVDI